jgi:hypothetical protein
MFVLKIKNVFIQIWISGARTTGSQNQLWSMKWQYMFKKSVIFQLLCCFPCMTKCILTFGNAVDGYLVIYLHQEGVNFAQIIVLQRNLLWNTLKFFIEVFADLI